MFLDDDVVLGAGCLGRLVRGLARRNGFAALGADSAGEMARELENWDYPRHVGMAATLFRREALDRLTFRWEPGKCECRCCCLDLRRAGLRHRLPGRGRRHGTGPIRATVDRGREPAIEPRERSRPDGELGTSLPPAARILTAFDRNHFLRFRRQFLTTLRAAGNREPLTAVTYGLQPTERSVLEAAGVEVVARHANGVSSALRQAARLPGCGGAMAGRDAGRLLGCGRRPLSRVAGAAMGAGPR